MASGQEPTTGQAAPTTVTPQQPPDEMLRSAVRREVGREMGGFLGVHVQAGPAPNVIAEKMTPEHITSVISNHEAESKRKDSRFKQFFWGSLIASVFLCIVFLWYGQQALLEKLLPLVFAFATGFAGGYGYKTAKS